jgi:hypothetical protein
MNSKIMLATPMFGGACAGIYAESLCKMFDAFARTNIIIQTRFVYGSSLIPAARTIIANEFMESDCTHLLFVDADTSFEPEYVAALLVRQTGETPYDIIAGPYLRKNIHWDKVARHVSKVVHPSELNDYTGKYALELLPGTEMDRSSKRPLEVAHIGTGFMMIRRATFEMFDKAYPERMYGESPKRMLYFQSEVQDNSYISEDVYFCRMIRKAGGKVWCCPWMNLGHYGNHTYGGPPANFVKM